MALPAGFGNVQLIDPAADDLVQVFRADPSPEKTDHGDILLSRVSSIASGGTGTTITTVGGTAYTLGNSDNRSVLAFTNNGAITLTIPAGLNVGISAMVLQLGLGTVTIAGSGATIHNLGGFTATAGQYGVLGILSYALNQYDLIGGGSGGSPSDMTIFIAALWGF